MAYRRPAERQECPETTTTAAFRVEHRSWVAIGSALAIAAVGIALAAVCVTSKQGMVLITIGMASPGIIVAFAFYLLVQNAGGVDLVVTPTADLRAVRVVLRRRWAFLPWTAPLVFAAARPPTLLTRWDTGRYSSKHGRGREFKHARLVLSVGRAEIPLPTTRGTRSMEGEVVVVDHSTSVLAERARYVEAAEALQAELGKARSDRRETRKRTGSPSAEIERPVADIDPASRILVAVREGAFGIGGALGLAAIGVVPAAFGLLAYALPASRAAVVSGSLVLPTFGCLIALVSAATTRGHTLHFQRKVADGVSITTVADLFLFGAVRQKEHRHALPTDFAFRVRKVISGEEESVSYSLVVDSTGEVIANDADEDEMRRYGKRLGGREVPNET